MPNPRDAAPCSPCTPAVLGYFIVTLDPELGGHILATGRGGHALNYQPMSPVLLIKFLLGDDRRSLDDSLP